MRLDTYPSARYTEVFEDSALIITSRASHVILELTLFCENTEIELEILEKYFLVKYLSIKSQHYEIIVLKVLKAILLLTLEPSLEAIKQIKFHCSLCTTYRKKDLRDFKEATIHHSSHPQQAAFSRHRIH